MHNSKLKQITVALCMALLPITVFAAGLGKLNVSSGLGEPLVADIELLSVTPEELNSIIAAIASEEAYTVQGIEKPASHNTIKVEVAKNSSGAPILKLKSSQPISEPFLDMLIQVDWASGRLLREYTVLLDPPGYTGEADTNSGAAQTTQAPMIKPSSTANDTQMADAPSGIKKSKRRAKSQPTEVMVNDGSSDVSGQEYMTQRGDSLAKIAQSMKPEGVSLDQMLVGLYQANPDAFDAKNMNRLKVGKIIRQPSEQELTGIARQDASKEVKVQSANWNAYRNKLAGIVAESAPSDTETDAQSAGGKIKSAAEDKSAPAAIGAKDVVKLSSGESESTKQGASGDIKVLQAKIAALQEENTAREKSVKEAQDRTAALEKQIEDMQKLLAIKSGAMSDMQKQAEMQAAADSAKANADATKPVELAQAEQPVAIVPAEPVAEAPVVTEVPVAVEPPKKPPVQAAPEPVAETSFLDGLDLPLLGSGAGLLALLGGGWMFLRNKRKRNLADFEQGIMTSGGLKANTVFGNTSGTNVDTGDTSFLTDFSQSANGGMIDTNDVDPIAEAEVYMAYGRDAQAEEILKDAITKEPKRYELHLKLLEMYASSKNVSAFETIAGELYTSLGAEDPTWAKVAEIGIKLEPSNPLYQVKASSGNAGVNAASSGAQLDANDFSDSAIASESDLDFSFDNDALVQNYASSTDTKDAFDLDLDALEAAPETLSAAAVDVENSAEMVAENTALDMPLVSVAPEPETTAAKDDDGLNFDFGDFTADTEEEVPASTEFTHTMPSINMAAFEISRQEPLVAVKPVLDDTLSALSFSADNEAQNIDTIAQESFSVTSNDVPDLSFPSLDVTDELEVTADSTLVGQFEVNDAELDSDFNFDITTVTPDAANYVEENLGEANSFDLSSITLDMDDNQATVDSMTISADDPIEIDTKLALVSAYIEMDDVEGAKEMLDEVMKEGSANQRKRAQEILAKLA